MNPYVNTQSEPMGTEGQTDKWTNGQMDKYLLIYSGISSHSLGEFILFNHDYLQNAPHRRCYLCRHAVAIAIAFAVVVVVAVTVASAITVAALVDCCLYPSAAITASSSSSRPLL